MPLGFTGFPRDPVSGQSVGIAQMFLTDKKGKKDKKEKKEKKSTSSDALSSWKAQEAARDSRQSTDTLPKYSEREPSTKQG